MSKSYSMAKRKEKVISKITISELLIYKESNASNLCLYSQNSTPIIKKKEISKSPKIMDSPSFRQSSLRGSFNGYDNKLSSTGSSMRLLASCPESPNQKKQATYSQNKSSYLIKSQKAVKIPGLKIVSIESKINPRPFSSLKKDHHKVLSCDSLIKKFNGGYSKKNNYSKKHKESSIDKSVEPVRNKNDKLNSQKLRNSSPDLILASKQNIFKRKNLCDKTDDSKLSHSLTFDEVNKVPHLLYNKEKSEKHIREISANDSKKEHDGVFKPVTLAHNKLRPNRYHKSDKKNPIGLKFQNKLYNYILDNPVSFID